jgi:actin-related protein 3
VIPTLVEAQPGQFPERRREAVPFEDLDFGPAYSARNVMKNGQIDDWYKLEQFLEDCLFKCLRCNPEDHAFLFVDPPLNPPENREATAEIMFEKFNVPYLDMPLSGWLDMAASWESESQISETGIVVDSGYSLTRIIPVIHGMAVLNAITHFPVAGRESTALVARMLRDREPAVPAEDIFMTARVVKERFCRVAGSLSSTFALFDANRAKYIIQYTGTGSETKVPFTCDVGYERFIAPEVIFSPGMVSSEYTTPLASLVHRAVRQCPIDTRMDLFSNIVLSGGSTCFFGFGKRLQTDVQTIVDTELRASAERASKQLGRELKAGKVPVKVIEHRRQAYAGWYGGAGLAMVGRAAFLAQALSKEQYDEHGPSIARVRRGTIDLTRIKELDA